MSEKTVNLNTEDLAKNVGEVAEKTVTNVTNIIEKHKNKRTQIRDTVLVVGAGLLLLKTRKDVKQLKQLNRLLIDATNELVGNTEVLTRIVIDGASKGKLK